MQTYLVVLFVAQCRLGPGRQFRSARPVVATSQNHHDLTPWTDLIGAVAEHAAGSKTYVSAEENRVRQVKAALKRLASDDVRLLNLQNENARVGKFEGFHPLDESARLDRASRRPYKVPVDGEDVFGVPAAFWLMGWHLALTDSEIALLFALWSRRGDPTPWPEGVSVRLDGETRIRQYGLGPDAYSSHKTLETFGLLEVTPDPDRRDDGTYVGFADGNTPIPHEFRIKEDAFERNAVAVVLASLRGRR